MFPKPLFAGIDLYSIFMTAGVVVAMLLIRVQADWRGMRAKWQNLLLITTIAAVLSGYGFAVLFQAFYNYMAQGVFEITTTTGATFYGGLIGGTVMYILIYFVAGHFLFPDKYHVKHFRTLSDLAAAAITAGHGLGRIGCLMAGCCHGRPTTAWYGIEMYTAPGWEKVIPVQLFEAIFLLALSALLLMLFKEGKKYLLSFYMMAYAVWRFIAELLRGDYRGATVVDFLTPSQFISVLLLAGGILLFGLQFYLDQKRQKQAETAEPLTDTDAPAATETDTPASESKDAPAESTDPSLPADEEEAPAAEETT